MRLVDPKQLSCLMSDKSYKTRLGTSISLRLQGETVGKPTLPKASGGKRLYANWFTQFY